MAERPIHRVVNLIGDEDQQILYGRYTMPHAPRPSSPWRLYRPHSASWSARDRSLRWESWSPNRAFRADPDRPGTRCERTERACAGKDSGHWA